MNWDASTRIRIMQRYLTLFAIVLAQQTSQADVPRGHYVLSRSSDRFLELHGPSGRISSCGSAARKHILDMKSLRLSFADSALVDGEAWNIDYSWPEALSLSNHKKVSGFSLQLIVERNPSSVNMTGSLRILVVEDGIRCADSLPFQVVSQKS